MFQNARRELLGPLHSLLKRPLEFRAVDSIEKHLRRLLETRPDYDALCELARWYDAQRAAVLPLLPALHAKLQDQLSIILPAGACVERTATSVRHGQGGAEPFPQCAQASAQIQLERLSDLLELAQCGAGDPSQDDVVCQTLQVMLLSEALALVLSGLACASRQSDGSLLLEPGDDHSLGLLKQVWFARWLDSNSEMALMVRIAECSAQAAGRSTQLDELLTHAVLDRALTVTWAFLESDATSHRSMAFAHDAARLVVFMLSRHGAGEMFIGRAQLREADLDDVLQTILAWQSKGLRTDWMVVPGPTGYMLAGGWDKALRCALVQFAQSTGETELLRRLIGGDGFERNYIRSRLERQLIQPQRYSVHEGIQKHHVLKDPPADLDVEYILHDSLLQHHYFIQAKHAARGEVGYLDSVVAALQKDLSDGLRQLRGAKACLEDGRLEPLWASRGLSGVTAANSSFLLVHNIAHVDLQVTHDGIALYDWRTLRNLLDDAAVTVRRPGEPEVLRRAASPLSVSNPMDVVQTLLSEHGIYAGAGQAAWAPLAVTSSMELVAGRVHMRALGI
ncbi:hypothetical protein [Stenotrophomonas maltophilia]|uniref:hypothetical protein n=1 Tax=Stenotrophomonas maltophilia TaxID=40324 RepID=UPI0007F04A60|nr:hypothetical protein [Stenotrophomonas maltophilia]OBU49936.1 hypothetical protein A9K76_09640 [Stenotrophomonas maltophilia]